MGGGSRLQSLQQEAKLLTSLLGRKPNRLEDSHLHVWLVDAQAATCMQQPGIGLLTVYHI